MKNIILLLFVILCGCSTGNKPKKIFSAPPELVLPTKEHKITVAPIRYFDKSTSTIYEGPKIIAVFKAGHIVTNTLPKVVKKNLLKRTFSVTSAAIVNYPQKFEYFRDIVFPDDPYPGLETHYDIIRVTAYPPINVGYRIEYSTALPAEAWGTMVRAISGPVLDPDGYVWAVFLKRPDNIYENLTVRTILDD